MTFASMFGDLIVLFSFLLAGFVIREIVKPLQRLYIPAAVIGGVLALIMGPQVLGWVEIPKSFGSMAGVMINLVLTCTVIGVDMKKSKLNAYLAHLCIMVSIYGMQMFLGTWLGSFLNNTWPELPFGWGTAAVFSFWGGHGTAAGAGKVWADEYGIQGITDIGMIMSTIGVLACMIVGMVIINWGVRRGYATQATNDYKANPSMFGGILPADKQTPIGMAKVSSSGIDNFSLQLSIVLACMLLGNNVMSWLKGIIPALKPLPALMNGILAGIVVWNIIKHTSLKGYVDRRTINSISGLGLEIIIVSAMATMNLKMVTDLFAPILIVSAATIIITAIFAIVLCKWWHRDNWFEKCCGSFGASMGTVPTGLALIRCVDPDGKTDAADTLAIGNSIWAPVYGSMPALVPMFAMTMGLYVPIWLGFALMVVPIVIGVIFFRQK